MWLAVVAVIIHADCMAQHIELLTRDAEPVVAANLRFALCGVCLVNCGHGRNSLRSLDSSFSAFLSVALSTVVAYHCPAAEVSLWKLWFTAAITESNSGAYLT